ncbi:hypothetical protein, partial [Arcobacter sp. CECT 8985]|uniref:hypothetical protein n=1 Tax=Arcobacter sp. CECT 8985 TaxID=1935424 RepID=UPI002159E5B7
MGNYIKIEKNQNYKHIQIFINNLENKINTDKKITDLIEKDMTNIINKHEITNFMENMDISILITYLKNNINYKT